MRVCKEQIAFTHIWEQYGEHVEVFLAGKNVEPSNVHEDGENLSPGYSIASILESEANDDSWEHECIDNNGNEHGAEEEGVSVEE